MKQRIMQRLLNYLRRIFFNKKETDIKPKYVSVWPAKVLEVYMHLLINKGKIHNDKADSLINLRLNQRVLIYNPEGPEIHDCQTGESYGKLEIVKCTGTVSWIESETSLILLDKNEDNNPAPEVNDLVKPI